MKRLAGFIAVILLFTAAPTVASAAEAKISRALFTSAILDREPVDELTSIDSSREQIFFFTELRNLEETTVTHRWTHGDEVLAEVEFKVRGSRWRVYSSKKLLPEWTKGWKVEIIAEDGTILETKELAHTGG